MKPKVNRWLDLLDRVGWTAIQALSGAVLVALTTDLSWQEGLTFVGVTTLAAVVKVVIAQNTGTDNLGSAVPGQVLEP
jgi:hypothetical protein